MLQRLQQSSEGFATHAAWAGCGGSFCRMKGLIRTMRHRLRQEMDDPENWERCPSCDISPQCRRCLGTGRIRKDTHESQPR